MITIPREEFVARLGVIQEGLAIRSLDALLVYGDEYRKENLRYVANYWPIFERAGCFIPRAGDPVLAGAPEGEKYAREMTPWADVRNIKEFACVTVPEEIDYPLAVFSSLREILGETLQGGRRLGVVGLADLPQPIYQRLREAAPSVEIVPTDDLLLEMRLIKSPAEIVCWKEAGRQACAGYAALLAAAVPGNTETFAAGAAEGAARQAGAEGIIFTLVGSGPRAETIIGRATEKVIGDGEMVMAALAVQYQGYVATAEFPFVAGTPSAAQRRFLAVLLEAANVQLAFLKEGAISGEMVRAVKEVFRRHHLEAYDVYPPMHGAGLAEAESPYPDEQQTYPLRAGMCVNSDISLWGAPGGSNRLEEGFVIGATGPESVTPLIRELAERGV